MTRWGPRPGTPRRSPSRGAARLTMSATADGAIWRGDGAKTNPTAVAPMPTASRASASVVMPQILTNTRHRRRRVRPRREASLSRIRAGRRRRGAGRPSGPGSPPPARPGTRPRPAAATSSAFRIPDSATATTSRGASRPRARARCAVHLEGAQVPLVHPDHGGAGPEGPLELGLVVHLDQGGQCPAARPGRGSGRSSPSVRAATISSTASAPMIRASQTSRALTVKSLRSTGSEQADRADRRSVGAAAEELAGRSGPTGRPPPRFRSRRPPRRGRDRGPDPPWTATAA